MRVRLVVRLPVLVLALLAVPLLARAGPATSNPMCPHLDTWNPKGIKGPHRTSILIVKYPAGLATQRGGTCSVMVEASYSRERERSYSFLAGGQFLVHGASGARRTGTRQSRERAPSPRRQATA